MGVRMLAIYSLPLGLLAAGRAYRRDRFAATRHALAAGGWRVSPIVLHWRADLCTSRAGLTQIAKHLVIQSTHSS